MGKEAEGTGVAALYKRINEIVRQGNVRRIVVSDRSGRKILDVPINAGVVAAVFAPMLMAAGAALALAGGWQIQVEHIDPQVVPGESEEKPESATETSAGEPAETPAGTSAGEPAESAPGAESAPDADTEAGAAAEAAASPKPAPSSESGTASEAGASAEPAAPSAPAASPKPAPSPE